MVVNLGILPSGSKMDEADFIFKTLASFNGGQLLNITLQAMATDRNLPFAFRARLTLPGQARAFQDQGDRSTISKWKFGLQSQSDANRAVGRMLFSIFNYRLLIVCRDDALFPGGGGFVKRRISMNPFSDCIAVNLKTSY